MSVENLSNEALKQLVKDTRKFKFEKLEFYKHQLYWRAWNELNNRYNAGDI